MSYVFSVVREDDTRGSTKAAFPVEPLPGDVIRLDAAGENLNGKFHVRRREITHGITGPVTLIVEGWTR